MARRVVHEEQKPRPFGRVASLERVSIAQHHLVGFTSTLDALSALVISKTTPDVILCDLSTGAPRKVVVNVDVVAANHSVAATPA